MFVYKHITPQKFIEHLGNNWVELDIMVIKRLHNKYLYRQDAEKEHVASFKVHLNRKQNIYSEYTLAVTITNAE